MIATWLAPDADSRFLAPVENVDEAGIFDPQSARTRERQLTVFIVTSHVRAPALARLRVHVERVARVLPYFGFSPSPRQLAWQEHLFSWLAIRKPRA